MEMHALVYLKSCQPSVARYFNGGLNTGYDPKERSSSPINKW